jgi:hypothetical protein
MTKKQYHPRLASLLNYFENNASGSASSSSHSSDSQKVVNISYSQSNDSQTSNISQSCNSQQHQSVLSIIENKNQNKITNGIANPNTWNHDEKTPQKIQPGVNNNSELSEQDNDSLREVNSDEIFEFLQALKNYDDKPIDEIQIENTTKRIQQSSEHHQDDLVINRRADQVLGSVENIQSGCSSTFVRQQKIDRQNIGRQHDCSSTVAASNYRDSITETILGSRDHKSNTSSRKLLNPCDSSERDLCERNLQDDTLNTSLTNYRKDISEAKVQKTVRFSSTYVKNSHSKQSEIREKQYIHFETSSDDSDNQNETDYSQENRFLTECRNTRLSSNNTHECPDLKCTQVESRQNQNSVKSLSNMKFQGSIASNNDINGTSRIVKHLIKDIQTPLTEGVNSKFDTSLLLPTSRLIVIDLWSDQKEVVTKALATLARSATAIKGKQEILDCGGHLAIVQILKKWSMTAEVVIEACNTLEKTSRFATFFADAVVLVGGLEVVLYCLKEYTHDDRIQGSGCSALCAIAWSRKNADFFVFKLHGVTAFTNAINEYPYSTIVMQNACWFFNHLSSWSDFRKPLVAAGVLGVLANAIETYTTDSNEDKIIQINAREALKKLVIC